MSSTIEPSVSEESAVVTVVVIRDVEIAVHEQAMGDHQIVRLVAPHRVLSMRRQRPGEDESRPRNPGSSARGCRNVDAIEVSSREKGHGGRPRGTIRAMEISRRSFLAAG